MTTRDYFPIIGREHWTGTSYDQAMQLGIECLRRSYTVPDDQGEDWSLIGQHQALQAAAWFAFARERREADTPQTRNIYPPSGGSTTRAPGGELPPTKDHTPKFGTDR